MLLKVMNLHNKQGFCKNLVKKNCELINYRILLGQIITNVNKITESATLYRF